MDTQPPPVSRENAPSDAPKRPVPKYGLLPIVLAVAGMLALPAVVVLWQVTAWASWGRTGEGFAVCDTRRGGNPLGAACDRVNPMPWSAALMGLPG